MSDIGRAGTPIAWILPDWRCQSGICAIEARTVSAGNPSSEDDAPQWFRDEVCAFECLRRLRETHRSPYYLSRRSLVAELAMLLSS